MRKLRFILLSLFMIFMLSGCDVLYDVLEEEVNEMAMVTEPAATDEPEAVPAPEPEIEEEIEDEIVDEVEDDIVEYRFRNNKLLEQHYQKHGIEMGFSSKEEYEEAASAVVNNTDALHKIESEDGDDIYYIEATNEFVVVSTDGYLRTYFNPSAGKKYYDRQ